MFPSLTEILPIKTEAFIFIFIRDFVNYDNFYLFALEITLPFLYTGKFYVFE